MTPLTTEEVHELMSTDRWSDLFARLREHFRCMAPLLPTVLSSLSDIERLRFTVLYLELWVPPDGTTH